MQSSTNQMTGHAGAAEVAKAVAEAASEPAVDIDFARRFGGVARLYGQAALEHFQRARVAVIGLGGVGSWAAEALARTAIGHLTLIDLDNVAESNVNRQLHALSDTLGMAKVDAMAARIRAINPLCKLTIVEEFVTPHNLEELIGRDRFDFIIDAMDDVKAKTALIAWCRRHALRIVTVGSAGGQIDPTRIEVRDLARTEQEPLLAKVRKRLRAEHGFPRGDKSRFAMEAVFSTEPVRLPFSPANEQCALPAASGNLDNPDHFDNSNNPDNPGLTGLNCAGFGSSVAVTASFGLVAAGRVLQRLAEEAGQLAVK